MSTHRNIVLIGLMGSGKTTVGKALKKNLSQNFEFVDTDIEIEKICGKSISEIFSQDGEVFFRDIETKVVANISKKNNLIISTGGGVVLREENIINLKQNGILFYLKAPAEVLANRLQKDESRPLLQNENKINKLMKLLSEREVFYNKSDIIVDTTSKSVDKIVEEILDCIK